MAAQIAPPPGGCSARIAPAADAAMGAMLALGTSLMQQATAHGLAFTLEEIGDITLPDPASAHVDRAQLRALASIYLAADLEPAGIIESVQLLASLSATGGLTLDLRRAAPLIEQWWRHRHDRMSADERNAFFSRLFGATGGPTSAEGGSNQRFEGRMFDLCEALSALDPSAGAQSYGTSMSQNRARIAARALAQNLGDSSTGMAAFVAGEVIATLKDAFAILGHPDLRGAFHARDIWDVIRAIAQLGHGSFADASPYVRRGKAGMILLAWLADSLPAVFGTGTIAKPGDPVVGAAIDWLEATLALGEGAGGSQATQAQTPTPTPTPTTGTDGKNAASIWSSLAG